MCEPHSIITEHIKKPKYCTNCGKEGHYYRQCRNPVTSYGVIAIDTNLSEENDKKFKELIETQLNKFDCNGIHDLETFNITKAKVKFLLIRRKHSLGFMEFIRGKYDPYDVDLIASLFRQMVQPEIDLIAKSNFDELWHYMWGDNSKHYDYIDAKKKFMVLKESKTNEIKNLHFYLSIEPKFEEPEWGFPKGRRNSNESDSICALREFTEETSIDNSCIKFLNIKPYIEDLTGTNGIQYRHVYFLALIDSSDIHVQLNKEDQKQMSEIGDIGMYDIDTCLDKFRDYHLDRKNIILTVFILVSNIISELIK